MAGYTEHYQLHQWEAGDDFLRTDFNEDFAKIDGAIAGRAQVAAGSYNGSGTYGSANPNSLTFNFAPKLVIVRNTTRDYPPMYLFAGETNSTVLVTSNSTAIQTVQWSDDGKTVSWYNTTNAEYQLNYGTYRYQYAAWG